MSAWNQWYVCVDDTTVGPVSTDLVVRGIEHRKIPFEALVCVVGGTTWVSMSSIDVFHAAVVRSYPPPPPDSEEARYWVSKGFRFPRPAPLPRLEALAAAPVEVRVPLRVLDIIAPPPPFERVPESPKSRVIATEAKNAPHRPPSSSDVEIEVDWSDVPEGIDWSRGFHGYFLADDAVELPDEGALLASLENVPRDVFRQDEALWNIALCLAFGSERIGEAAGRIFYDVVVEQGALERLAWMSRTLLGNGFLPSGIPVEAGRRAFDRLRALCPAALAAPAPQRVA